MRTVFNSKAIEGILCVLPETESFFDDEVSNYNFPEKQTLRLKKVMGYNKHRLTKDTSALSDYAVLGIKYLADGGYLDIRNIGAIITVTLSPDYFVPHISNIVHGECEFDRGVLCMDISQGCCGFLLGLMEAFMLLDRLGDKKVLLINGDILSRKVSKRDRNDFPLIGDAAALTLISNSEQNPEIPFELYTDGSQRDALKIPAGAFKMPSSPETSVMIDQGDGNLRALDHMHMDGAAVFNFVQREVPSMLKNAYERAAKHIADTDYFLFHQPNKFMLQKLAESAGMPQEKLFMNIVENFGNPSGASIPLAAAFNLKDILKDKTVSCCLSAFGSGLTWGVILMDIGPLKFCEIIESNL